MHKPLAVTQCPVAMQVLGAAHSMFHLRDTWRVYYFDLSMLSSRYWRVSHALSHHLYPNTMRDLEVTEFSPFLLYMPFQVWAPVLLLPPALAGAHPVSMATTRRSGIRSRNMGRQCTHGSSMRW